VREDEDLTAVDPPEAGYDTIADGALPVETGTERGVPTIGVQFSEAAFVEQYV